MATTTVPRQPTPGQHLEPSYPSSMTQHRSFPAWSICTALSPPLLRRRGPNDRHDPAHKADNRPNGTLVSSFGRRRHGRQSSYVIKMFDRVFLTPFVFAPRGVSSGWFTTQQGNPDPPHPAFLTPVHTCCVSLPTLSCHPPVTFFSVPIRLLCYPLAHPRVLFCFFFMGSRPTQHVSFSSLGVS